MNCPLSHTNEVANLLRELTKHLPPIKYGDEMAKNAVAMLLEEAADLIEKQEQELEEWECA